jgi:hypothetical protein
MPHDVRRLVCLFALAAACGDLPQVADLSTSVDANSEKCPAQKPMNVACELPANITCNYPGSACVCAGSWACRSAMCPSRAQASGDCPRALSCDYGFGDVCTCVAPENQWLCCLPAPVCLASEAQIGSRCCGTAAQTPCALSCGGGSWLTCSCQASHWSCAPSSCAVDGGASD